MLVSEKTFLSCSLSSESGFCFFGLSWISFTAFDGTVSFTLLWQVRICFSCIACCCSWEARTVLFYSNSHRSSSLTAEQGDEKHEDIVARALLLRAQEYARCRVQMYEELWVSSLVCTKSCARALMFGAGSLVARSYSTLAHPAGIQACKMGPFSNWLEIEVMKMETDDLQCEHFSKIAPQIKWKSKFYRISRI